ncbi:hypothetical protein BH24ACT9_BH24ACT9_11910 [soil metagenome]
MTDELRPEDFAEFFHAIHGHEPFTWQRDLLNEVHEQRSWPELIDVPTGGGKTAVLDVALFALALDTANPPDRRWAPRRIVMVVDRRVVVDQTRRRADAIVESLSKPTGEVVSAVAAALSDLSVERLPAMATTLRGGLVRDVSWAKWPDVPTLISSTVDQVGSRLLFRGYGVSAGMRPIHAGLLGNDTVILLDEVHLSQPFAQTLRTIRDRYQEHAELVLPGRWHVAELSATPGRTPSRTFVVAPDQVSPEGPDSALAMRFLASKPVQLVTAARQRGDDRPPVVAAAVDQARRLLKQEHVRRLGVVVNRVASAHQIAAALRMETPPKDSDVDVLLLTGRMRPFDRDDAVGAITGRLAAGVPRDPGSRRLVLVATQCIEAGADLDLDGLVTECASLDALRQRFGRVDRLGALADRGTPAPGAIIGQRPDIDVGADDPVYGGALSATWAWLSQQTDLDFGVTALELPTGSRLDELLARKGDAPLLRPGDLDRWVQTQPVPRPDPDPSLWLHGLNSASADVQLVWRADLTADLLKAGVDDADVARIVSSIVNAAPPGGGEAVSVPIGACRGWLARRETTAVADVDGAEMPAPDEESQRDLDSRRCLRWAGDGSEILRSPASIRPGDVIVVPAEYGGYAAGGWSPTATDPVPDLSHRVEVEQRRRVTLRLSPMLWSGFPTPPAVGAADLDEATDALRAWLAAGPTITDPPTPAEPWWIEAAASLSRFGFRLRVEDLPAPTYVVVGRRPLHLTGDSGIESVDSEPDTSAFTAVDVALDDHLREVGALAGQLARGCHLPETVASDLELAGRVHDLGKADQRFQLMLHGGDEVSAALAARPLAKSGVAANDRSARLLAAQRSRYPQGMRHEISSIEMIEGREELMLLATDWDLVLHLVASHHGHARPFAPAIVDPDPRSLRHHWDGLELTGSSGHSLAAFDSGIADRFWRVVRRYGWFRLAWLEAILRLADHRRSEREQLERGVQGG